jgi:hypothetical protein
MDRDEAGIFLKEIDHEETFSNEKNNAGYADRVSTNGIDIGWR